MANDDDKKAAFDHPCRETCSGWRQGFDRGQSDLREKLMKGSPEFDAYAFATYLRLTPFTSPLGAAKWQHEQSRLREAAFKQDSERAEQFAREEAARRFDVEQARDAALAEVERLKADAKPLVLAEVHRTYAERDRLRAERDEYKKLAEQWMRDHDALKDKYEPTVLMEQGLRAEVERMGNELNWGDRELKDRACEIDRLKRELIEANATCVKVSRLGTEELTAERAKAQNLVRAAKELRIYCLGSDASTLNMIKRFDDAIVAYKETK